MNYNVTNAYYFNHLNTIGGIESHLWYIAKKYKDIDIAIFYKTGDYNQIRRLEKYVKTIQLEAEDTITCEKIFCCFNKEVLDICNAKEKNLVIHGDYLDMVNRKQLSRELLPIDDRIDNYYAVTQGAAENWTKLTGIKSKCIYEPVVLDKVDEPLLFISATRLSKEKGWERMVVLAEEMNKANINYIWLVFTDTEKEYIPEGIILVRPNLNINKFVGIADAFIQLSDNEGYCLSVIEAEARGVPCITTPIPIFRNELELNDLNSIEIDFDMKNIPIEKIKNIKHLKENMPKYKIKEDKWMEVLENKKSDYKIVKVRATENYKKLSLVDVTLGHIPEIGEEWEIPYDRYIKLSSENSYDLCFVELVEDIKEEKFETVAEEIKQKRKYNKKK